MTVAKLAVALLVSLGFAEGRQEDEKKAEKLEQDLAAVRKKIESLTRDGGKNTPLRTLRETILKFADAYREAKTCTLKSKDGAFVIVLGSATVKDKNGEAVEAKDDAATLLIAVGGDGGADWEYDQKHPANEHMFARPGGKAVAKAKEGFAIAIGGRGGRGTGTEEKRSGTATVGASCRSGGPGGDAEAESAIGSIALGGAGGELDPSAEKAWRTCIQYVDAVDARPPRPIAGVNGKGAGATNLDKVARWLKEKKD